MWTILRVNISWGLSLGLPPHFCEFYLQEPHQVFTVKIMEKSLVLPAGGGEVPILKYTLRGSNHPEICPACSFLHLSSGETSPDPDLPGERGILNSEPSSLPVLLSKGPSLFLLHSGFSPWCPSMSIFALPLPFLFSFVLLFF